MMLLPSFLLFAAVSYKRDDAILYIFSVSKVHPSNGTITNSRKHQTAQLGFATVESTSFSMSCHNNCVRAIKQEMYNSGVGLILLSSLKGSNFQ